MGHYDRKEDKSIKKKKTIEKKEHKPFDFAMCMRKLRKNKKLVEIMDYIDNILLVMTLVSYLFLFFPKWLSPVCFILFILSVSIFKLPYESGGETK